MAQLDDIRAECLADDIDIPAEAVSWIECEARTFFESGGTCFPRKQGLEGAETLAWCVIARHLVGQCLLGGVWNSPRPSFLFAITNQVRLTAAAV
jgi:hypothetical protein